MLKFVLIITISFIISSCVLSEKPFGQNNNETKINKNDFFISEIIGLNKQQTNKLKEIIHYNLTKKNILSSFKYSNKNSNIVTASIVKYPNNYNVLWKINNPNKGEKIKYKFIIDNHDLNKNNLNLSEIAFDITKVIENNEYKNNDIIFIKIKEIYGLKDRNKKQFFKALTEISQNYKIKYDTNDKDKNPFNYKLTIIFNLSKLNTDNTEINVNWIIEDFNNKEIANLRQSKIIDSLLLQNIWEQLSRKIIEMAMLDINYLINLEK